MISTVLVLYHPKKRLEPKEENFDEAANFLREASVLLESEILWRKDAMPKIIPALIEFQNDTASHIGLRGQERLPKFLVPRISRCKSANQNISLSF